MVAVLNFICLLERIKVNYFFLAYLSVSKAEMSKPAPDTIDRTVAFLQKREGIDKALKLIRYTASLISAASPNKDTELISRLSALEKSIGQSR